MRMIKDKKFEEEENQENPGLKAGKTLLKSHRKKYQIKNILKVNMILA